MYLYFVIDNMKRILNSVCGIALCLSILSFTGCGNSTRRDFNKLLVELAGSDATVDHADWEKIAAYLDGQKVHFGEFYKNGQLDVEALKGYIADFFNRRRPSKEISFVGISGKEYMNVKFYLERSGSMIGYDSPRGDGSFKAAIVQMLNSLPGNDNTLYVVNSSINMYPQGFRKFLSDPNIFEATKGIGDPSYTDFGAIFSEILNKTGDDELSVLVTDMIYSTKSMAGVNPQKVFSEAQGMIDAVFKAQVKQRSMLIVKLRGAFNGPYYAYNNSVKEYNGYRPYYVVVVGSHENIARLTKDKNYTTFAQFAELRGYEDMCLFNTDGAYKPYYSLLLDNKDIRGRFQPERGQDSQITRIESVEQDRNSGDIKLALVVDLSKMLIDKDYLENPQNYTITSDDKVFIQAIRKVERADMTPAERKYIGSGTHIFVLHVDKVNHEQKVSIKLMNRLPAWVEASSADDDSNIGPHTTFGLKYLLQGIYNSYRKNSDGEPYYFDLELNLDD